jgi:hypothetical protein
MRYGEELREHLEVRVSSCSGRRPHLPFKALLVASLIVTLASIGAAPALADSGLRYFGYFAARITEGDGNHVPAVTHRTNLNWIQISDPDRYAPEVLPFCTPRGCIVSTGHEFFREECLPVHSPDCGLHPDYKARWGRLADAVRPHIDRVGAFYLMDEPQWRGASPGEIETAARTIKATYPDIPVMMVEAGPQVSPSLQVPRSVDWVGFDWYCQPFSTVERTLATLTSRIHPGQKLFLVPEAAPLEACGGAPGHATDPEIAALQYDYFDLARSNPRVIGLLAFGFWTSGFSPPELPRIVAAHTDIFSRITAPAADPGQPVEIKARRARISRRGAVRVRLRCPEHSARACAGELALRQRKGQGKTLASGPFQLQPATKDAVRVRVVSSKRRRLLNRAGRRKGMKVKAVATTPAGETTKKLVLRASRRR